MKRRMMWAVLALLLPLSSACSGDIEIGSGSGVPTCPAAADQNPDDISSGLLLIAQSVPSATLLPCTRELPPGWMFERLDADNHRSRIFMNSDRHGSHATTVTLAPHCDVGDSTETATDQPGTRRYERVHPSKSSYRAERYYVYDGGCTTYQISLHGSRNAEPVDLLLAALSFATREQLRRYVHSYSDGRFELDPTAAGGSG
ncbi:MAG: hypothetical protein QOK10_2579 [Pseudonocardiales bacterium]|jgi:hypothetical protein|nr:hypothetical protein [Pseudonocardiales bacterium]